MFRKTFLITALTLFISALTGCHLYQGEEGGNGDPDGDNGDPDGSTDGCTADEQCPSGNYCDEASGACLVSWTCDPGRLSPRPALDPLQCRRGFECDDRGTCVPRSCGYDGQCLVGCYCDRDAGECTESTTCDALGNCPGALECDQDRNTCAPVDKTGWTCQGIIFCASTAPICPVGSTAITKQGCYTGQCMLKADCPDGAPLDCSDLNDDEVACIADTTCGTVYKGVDCTAPDGSECTSGSANCTCESFEFDYCEAN